MSKQIFFGNLPDSVTRGTVEKYHNEKTIFETTPHLTISTNTGNSNVNLTGSFYATRFQARSDQKLKSNISYLEDSLDCVKKIDGRQYYLNSDLSNISFGFIAQELETVLPNLVHTDLDGYKTVSYMEIIPLLLNAIKELNTKVDRLEVKCNNLRLNLPA